MVETNIVSHVMFKVTRWSIALVPINSQRTQDQIEGFAFSWRSHFMF